MLYKISEYNNNGYHDSYWGIIAYNSESKEIIQMETGSTAYFCRTDIREYNQHVPENILEEIRKYYIRNNLEEAIKRRESRTSFDNGELVEASRNFKHKGVQYKKGLKGEVRSSKNFNYGRGYDSIGIQTEEGFIFTSAKNLNESVSNYILAKQSIRDANGSVRWIRENMEAA